MKSRLRVMLFANTDWYLYNFRLSLAKSLRQNGHEIVMVSPHGDYGAKIVSEGFRWVSIPMLRRSLNPIREAFLVFWLFRFILRENFDLIHCFTIKCAVYGSLATRLVNFFHVPPVRVNAVAGMGYVFTSDEPRARLLRPVVRLLMRLALEGSDARLILQNQDDVALFIHGKLIGRCNIRLIPGSGVDCQHFRPADDKVIRKTESEPFRVLLAARILWDKGLSEYVAAARLLKSLGRRIDFFLAGRADPGNPASVSQDTIQSWVDEGILEYLGHVEDMIRLYHSVDLVVLPSYREGLPKSLIEAAACGLPIMTTDVPGCRDAVTHGIDGLIVPPRDVAAFAEAIVQLQEDSELRDRLGSAARERALAKFDERIIIQKTISVYRELIPF